METKNKKHTCTHSSQHHYVVNSFPGKRVSKMSQNVTCRFMGVRLRQICRRATVSCYSNSHLRTFETSATESIRTTVNAGFKNSNPNWWASFRSIHPFIHTLLLQVAQLNPGRNKRMTNSNWSSYWPVVSSLSLGFAKTQVSRGEHSMSSQIKVFITVILGTALKTCNIAWE